MDIDQVNNGPTGIDKAVENFQQSTLMQSESEMALSRRWLSLALLALTCAGLLALFLVIGRLPIFSNLIGDPGWVKKSLVVHVNLALNIWPYAFIAAMYSFIPNKSGEKSQAAPILITAL